MRSIVIAILIVAGLLSAKAWAAPFDIGFFDGELSPIPDIEYTDVFMPIETTVPDFDYSQLVVSSNTAWVTPEVDVAGRRVRLKLNTTQLVRGTYTIEITATHGSNVVKRTLPANTVQLNVSRLLDDPSPPYRGFSLTPRMTAPLTSLLITSPPTSFIAEIGSGNDSPLTVTVNKSEVTYQWFKDSVVVPDATQSTYLPSYVQPQHAGYYYCQINDGVNVVETEPVVLGVIEKTASPNPLLVAVGGSFSLGLNIYPAELESQLTYAWRVIAPDNLSSVGTIVGEDASTLTVSNVTPVAATSFYCKVGYGREQMIVGYYTVQLLPLPQITAIPDTSVITGYWVNIPVGIVGATTIRVTGLPPGLVYDSESRHIIGSSNALQNYVVTVEAENDSGAAVPVTFQLNVIPYPESLAGTYRGILMNGGEAPYEHGGLITFQITKTAAASGTVTLRGKTYRLVTIMNVAEADGKTGYLEATFQDREGNPYGVKVAIATNVSEVFLYKNTEAGPVLLLNGFVVRNPWTAKNPAPGAGLINVALQPYEENLGLDYTTPQGTGFLNLKLSAGGVVTVKGRLADGKVVTASTLMGPAGDMPVFVNSYKHRGGLTSLITYASDEVTGTALWSKDDLGAQSRERVYKAGFGRHALLVEGGRYVRPVPNEAWPPFPSTAPQAVLTMSRGGLEVPISQALSFDNRYRALLPRQSEQNPYGLTLKLNLATGVFRGTFKLENENPANPSKPLRRTVTYHGSLIPGVGKGVGFFLLPDLPDAGTPTSTLKNTPIWSGGVDVMPNVTE